MPRANWRGETNAEWNGRDKARRVVRTLGYCETCGAVATDRHHRDGNPTNNERSNIACLCRRCHMRVDGRLDGMRSLPRQRTMPPRPCANCSTLTKPNWQGMCRHCYDHARRGTVCKGECASHTERTTAKGGRE